VPERSQFLTLQNRGLLALPPDVRRRHHLDQPGAQVELVERDDGVLEIRPYVPVPADQAWFWTESWQAGEREASEDLDQGRGRKVKDAESFLASLDDE
jgi:bifunctional DNA-binding transcriptional regulator/antitoxin component of YhaV-PrlF toxin-antitoxin module